MGKDKSRNLLKRYVRDRYTNFWFTEYRGDYRIGRQDSKETTGSYVLTHLPEKYVSYYKLYRLKITPDSHSDTTGMSANIGRIINMAEGASIISVQLKSIYVTTHDMKVRYMGKDNGCHVFSLVKPFFASQTGKVDGFQTIIYADEKSGEIVLAKTTLMYADGRIIELSANYAICKKPKYWMGADVIYPTRVEGRESGEKDKVSFLIENITSRMLDPKPIPRKDR